MSVADIIFLRELKIEATIGVYDWEQLLSQTILIDVDFTSDIRKAAKSELVKDTIDYADMIASIKAFAAGKKFALLETVVENIAELLLQKYPIRWVRICGRKLAVAPNIKEVGIVIERSKA